MENLSISSKYFTPEIGDLRIGGEYEVSPSNRDSWGWTLMDINSLKAISSGFWKVRIQYLTREQIEAEGWVKQNNEIVEGMKANWIPDFTFKSLKEGIIYKLFVRDCLIYISKWTTRTGTWEMSGEHQIFEGTCKDIYTFRYISKLLDIK